jgi:hypothetical protein
VSVCFSVDRDVTTPTVPIEDASGALHPTVDLHSEGGAGRGNHHLVGAWDPTTLTS